MILYVVDHPVNQKPADVVEEKREEQIFVDSDSWTGELFEDEEDGKRGEETDDRHDEKGNIKSVDIVDDTDMLHVDTVGVVAPGSIGDRM